MENEAESYPRLVECSDPGPVISLAEEFEHVLRQVDMVQPAIKALLQCGG